MCVPWHARLPCWVIKGWRHALIFFPPTLPNSTRRYYRRLLQMGVRTTELWNNVGMCCFFAQQYDMALGCLRHALQLASDDGLCFPCLLVS